MSRMLSAEKVKTALTAELSAMTRGKSEIACGILRIGEAPADLAYERGLLKAFSAFGITAVLKNLPASAAASEVRSVIADWNSDSAIKGILPLLPFPGDLGEALKIAPQKDIDGVCGHDCFFPCTPQAVMYYLQVYQIPLKGIKAAVLGRSARVGKPLAELLRRQGAEVSVVHSQTANPQEVIQACDLVCSAVGKPRFLNGDLLGRNQTVIDIGINADPLSPGKICGDFDAACAEQRNLSYTPVPGGIGAVTTLILIRHLLTQGA